MAPTRPPSGPRTRPLTPRRRPGRWLRSLRGHPSQDGLKLRRVTLSTSRRAPRRCYYVARCSATQAPRPQGRPAAGDRRHSAELTRGRLRRRLSPIPPPLDRSHLHTAGAGRGARAGGPDGGCEPRAAPTHCRLGVGAGGAAAAHGARGGEACVCSADVCTCSWSMRRRDMHTSC